MFISLERYIRAQKAKERAGSPPKKTLKKENREVWSVQFVQFQTCKIRRRAWFGLTVLEFYMLYACLIFCKCLRPQ